MHEKVVQFGPNRSLVGVLALPDARAGSESDLAVILLSTGVLHRVGSNRLYVDLARALARAAVPALRFDLSGVGDSQRRSDVTSMRESVSRDITDAIAYLAESHGVHRVILMGLCSGAYDAFRAASTEQRVVGAYMVDMPGPFRDWRHTTRHVLARLFKPRSWRNPLRKLWGHSVSMLQDTMPRRSPSGGLAVLGGRSRDSREVMREELDALLARGVRLHFSFTAGLEDNYNHPSQFRFAFPRAARHPLVSYDFFPEPDHSFGSREMRERLIARAVSWVHGGTPDVRRAG